MTTSSLPFSEKLAHAQAERPLTTWPSGSRPWAALGDALVMAGGAYARTIWALSARGGILPAQQFAPATATGAGAGQVDAEEVKVRLIDAGLLEEVKLEGVGTVVGFVKALQHEHMIAQLRGRLIAEEILLDSLNRAAPELWQLGAGQASGR